jgi:hypothetical protein
MPSNYASDHKKFCFTQRLNKEEKKLPSNTSGVLKMVNTDEKLNKGLSNILCKWILT